MEPVLRYKLVDFVIQTRRLCSTNSSTLFDKLVDFVSQSGVDSRSRRFRHFSTCPLTKSFWQVPSTSILARRAWLSTTWNQTVASVGWCTRAWQVRHYHYGHQKTWVRSHKFQSFPRYIPALWIVPNNASRGYCDSFGRKDKEVVKKQTASTASRRPSTHWVVYDSKRNMIGHTRENSYDWYTETEFLEDYAGCHWLRYAWAVISWAASRNLTIDEP